MDHTGQIQISIIIAVYNGKELIDRCVESVLSQTLTGFELIIVDDASTDGTWEHLRERYGADSRIKLIHHERNLGVSDARNTALRAARGEYIAPIDHDDFLEPEYLEGLYNAAKSHDADCVLCGVRGVYPDGAEKVIFSATHDIPGGMPSIRVACECYSNLSTWGRLISRRVIEENDLRYMRGGMEDVYFNFRVMYYCRHYISFPDILYNKYERRDSLSRSGLSGNFNYVRTLCEVMDRAAGIIDEIRFREPLSQEDEDNIYKFFLFISLKTMRRLFHPDTRQELYKALAEYLPRRFGKDAPYIRSFLLLYTIADVRVDRLEDENKRLKEQIRVLQESK